MVVRATWPSSQSVNAAITKIVAAIIGYQPCGESRKTSRIGTKKIRTSVIVLGQFNWCEPGGSGEFDG